MLQIRKLEPLLVNALIYFKVMERNFATDQLAGVTTLSASLTLDTAIAIATFKALTDRSEIP
jgi:hypothetical protein